jgi:hypothetical protein
MSVGSGFKHFSTTPAVCPLDCVTARVAIKIFAGKVLQVKTSEV